MTTPDLLALADRVLSRAQARPGGARPNCPAVPSHRNGTVGHLLKFGGISGDVAVPSGSIAEGAVGHSQVASVPPVPNGGAPVGQLGHTLAATTPEQAADEAADREAIAAEPLLPIQGTAERVRLDRAHATMLRGLLAAARLPSPPAETPTELRRNDGAAHEK